MSVFGSEMGAVGRCEVRSEAVTVPGQTSLTCGCFRRQRLCRGVRSVRDEEAAGSNPATPTSSKATPPTETWPFSVPYSRKVQQCLRAKLPPEPLERVERLGVGDLGVDVHRHVDLRMPQDPHGNPGMHVERGQQSGTGMPVG